MPRSIMFKRNPDKLFAKKFGPWVRKKMLKIIADKSRDYSKKDIVALLIDGGLPESAYDDMVAKIVDKEVDTQLRFKRKVGTYVDKSGKTRPLKIRVVATYEKTDPITEKVTPCKREWKELNHWEHRSALNVLFRNDDMVHKEAVATLAYVNDLRLKTGYEPFGLEEFSNRDDN